MFYFRNIHYSLINMDVCLSLTFNTLKFQEMFCFSEYVNSKREQKLVQKFLKLNRT